MEGTPVRLAGQDSRRGTFGQRHAVLVDRKTGDEYTAAAATSPRTRPVHVYDSLLSEYAAMGFEYGYSVARTRTRWSVGGAVRRLRQRRADDHRRVHLSGEQKWGQRPASCCCCRTATRARARTTPRPASSGSCSCARGQHDGRHADHAGELLPPAAPAGLRPAPQAAGRLHPEVDAAAQAAWSGCTRCRAPRSRPRSPSTRASRSSSGRRRNRPTRAAGRSWPST
jgi:hypothetical protein